jgi:hypothetical protein
MFAKLLPEQISKFWDVIKYGLEQTLPPIAGDHPDRMNRVLTACLCGKADVWASYTRDNGVGNFEGFAVTRIIFDDVSSTFSLLIYTIYAYSKVSSSTWLVALRKLAAYAKLKNCRFVVAYTDFPGIVEISKRLGGDIKFFLRFDVEKILSEQALAQKVS